MSGRGLYFLVAAGVLGCAAASWAFMTGQNSSGDAQAQAQTAAAPVEMTKIVVASKTIEVGEIISLDNLTLKPWPKTDLPFGSYQALNLINENPDFTRTALTRIAAGSPVLDSRLSVEAAQTAIASRLAPGMRAYSIRIDEVSGVAGFILPGSRVDVLHTHKKKDAPVATRILLTGIQVLAVDRNHDLTAEQPTLANTATLAVSLDQARELSVAANDGRLSLALVGADESKDAVQPAPILASLQTNAVSKPAPARAVRSRRPTNAPKRPTKPTATPVTIVLGDDVSQETVPNAPPAQPVDLLGGPVG